MRKLLLVWCCRRFCSSRPLRAAMPDPAGQGIGKVDLGMTLAQVKRR